MPSRRATSRSYHHSIILRKEPTDAERKLWSILRANKLNDVSFRRQHALGGYVVDFCAIKAKLVIELDGSQHLEQGDYDSRRTQELEKMGYTVIRFWNNQVLNDLNGVIIAITQVLEDLQN